MFCFLGSRRSPKEGLENTWGTERNGIRAALLEPSVWYQWLQVGIEHFITYLYSTISWTFQNTRILQSMVNNNSKNGFTFEVYTVLDHRFGKMAMIIVK